MVTMQDIAEEAGVSKSTVSRALDGGRNLDPKTVQRVKRAAESLGYIKTAVRRGGQSRRRQGIHTGTITFLSVHQRTPQEMYEIPIFSPLLGEIQEIVTMRGMDLTLAHSPDGNFVPPALARKKTDGVLLAGNAVLGPSLRKSLSNIPCVWCFRGAAEGKPKFDHVDFDKSCIGEMAANYLFGRGHQHLAYADFPTSNLGLIDRREQFIEAVKKHGGSVEIATVSKSYKDRNDLLARVIIENLLKMSPRPTGMFVSTDERMVSLFYVLREKGLEPGRDIELIGCNNDKTALQHLHPRPATIDPQMGTVGARAVEQLFFRMASPNMRGQTEILVKPELVPPEEGENIKETVSKEVMRMEG